MLSVDAALEKILHNVTPLQGETLGLSHLVGRIAARDITAQLTQPPFNASAMDGYAVRFSDCALKANLTVIGEAPAGAPFAGSVGPDQAVRIYTGGVVPDGADHVVIQEDVAREGDQITLMADQPKARNIRQAGVDFHTGETLVKAGDRFNPIHGALLAAANIAEVSVVKRPKLAIFSNGDELREPGSALQPGEIINSNHYALSAMAEAWGSDVTYLGCAPDDEATIVEFFKRGQSADILVPVGGASVGDYDYVKTAFAKAGGEIVFEKIAVRPGKPTWLGQMGKTRVIGLPGNPASAIVTAALFVQPLARALAGQGQITDQVAQRREAVLSTDLSANGRRETYLRGTAKPDDAGVLTVEVAPNQDSSLLSPFAKANVLVKRQIDAPAAKAGERVPIVWL